MNRPPRESLRAALVLVAALTAFANPALGATVADTGAASGGFSWHRFLSPFHMVMLHLPIGFFIVASLLEVWNWRKPSVERREVTQVILLIGLVATGVTMGLGYLRAMDGGYDEILLRRHQGWGIASVALMAVAWGLHRSLLRESASGGLVGFRVLLFTGLVSLVVAGHHGGSLTHGVTFLTENAPQQVRELFEESPVQGATAGSHGPASAGFATVRPVLAAKCFTCHGPEKQKGKLRLDEREAALKGGESGRPALVPGDPGRSELVRSVMLARDHDEAMPPEGKDPLTAAELGLILDWIRAGAGY